MLSGSREPAPVGVDRLQPGDHACLAFSDDDERWEVIGDFARHGFARGEKVCLSVDATGGVDHVAALAAGGESAARTALASGQLVVSRALRFGSGGLDPGPLAARALRHLENAAAEGFSGVRSANEFSLAAGILEDVVEFEKALHQALAAPADGPRYTALCHWDDRRREQGASLTGSGPDMDAIRVLHPVTVISRPGTLHVRWTAEGIRAATEAVAEAAGLLGASRRVLVLTGAGISTDSGIPDFRGPQGVWTKDPAAEKLSTLQHSLADPAVRRRAWQARLASPAWHAEPNAGHRALVELERQGRLQLLVTQNIDGLHQQAGNDPDLVVEIHGTAREVVCMTCGHRQPAQPVLERVRTGDADPACLAAGPSGRPCGGILKSATISFGQSLVAADLERADAAARNCDLLLAVGTTLAVYPAAGLVPTAHLAGARIVIVNGAPTDYDTLADAVVRGSISEVLPAVVGPSAGLPTAGRVNWPSMKFRRLAHQFLRAGISPA